MTLHPGVFTATFAPHPTEDGMTTLPPLTVRADDTGGLTEAVKQHARNHLGDPAANAVINLGDGTGAITIPYGVYGQRNANHFTWKRVSA